MKDLSGRQNQSWWRILNRGGNGDQPCLMTWPPWPHATSDACPRCSNHSFMAIAAMSRSSGPKSRRTLLQGQPRAGRPAHANSAALHPDIICGHHACMHVWADPVVHAWVTTRTTTDLACIVEPCVPCRSAIIAVCLWNVTCYGCTWCSTSYTTRV
jgi:hypothetical protein